MTIVLTPGEQVVTTFLSNGIRRVPESVTAAEVAKVLTDRDVGLVTIGARDEVLGVVSERDIVHAVAAGRDLTATPALDIASTELVWCDATATVSEVAAEMMDQYVRHVLVEAGGHLLGVVSARDLLGAYVAADLADAELAPPDDGS